MSNWIQGAVKHPGAFTASAKKAGQSVAAHARSILRKGSSASTTQKRRAVFAENMQKIARNK